MRKYDFSLPSPTRFKGRGIQGTDLKNYSIAALAEFVGTFFFLFFAFSAVQASTSSGAASLPQVSPNAPPQPIILLYISLAFGFSQFVNTWVFYRVSGGLFNPAVTWGFFMFGKFSFHKTVVFFISELVGGIAAAAVAQALYPGGLAVDNRLGLNTNRAQGLFIEVFMTCQFMLTILMLGVEKHRGTYLAPLGVGFSLLICHMIGVLYTGCSVNPARSFGPAVVQGSFPTYHWIYWVGPLFGSTLAVAFYRFLKFVDYSTVNPGQDDERDLEWSSSRVGEKNISVKGGDSDSPATDTVVQTHTHPDPQKSSQTEAAASQVHSV